MRLVVLGADGLFGTTLVRVADGDPRVSAVVAAGRADADVTRPGGVERLLRQEHPDVVVNAASITSADRCEAEPELAYQVNAVGAGRVARACTDVGARCVVLSTDIVFDGTKGESYDETDTPHPVLTCGVSKVAGEFETLRAGPRHLVVRTSALFGPAPRSPRARHGFVDRILRRAAVGERPRVVDNVVISPTYAVDLSLMLLELLRATPHGGIFHLVNIGAANWYELACAAVSVAGLAATPYRSPDPDGYAVAPRPPSTPLRSVRVPPSVRRLNRPWADALRCYVQEYARPAPSDLSLPLVKE
ncbi:MAG: hypothetical protein AUG44_20080 [Actinobacteria bacterium 13_1_20CM_3_71_11]|nr:MAG: hypothetical protein AUG44_20080 [Actinobacteria bacterium 13_1_20CM_3_71_11]